jgi:hypothetical protein
MLRQIAIAALALSLATPALAEEFNPLGIARDAAQLGLETARRAVDLGLDTAEEAADVAEDAVTFDDDCPKGERYKGRDGRWRTCD